MTIITFRTFSSPTSDDACRDTILAHRMKQLEWVQPDHLEMSLDLRSEVVVTAIHKARQGRSLIVMQMFILCTYTHQLIDLLEIDTKKSPLEKLQCIVKCCNSIFGILKHYCKIV